jgi:F-type H+-transporting ATPase subunit b
MESLIQALGIDLRILLAQFVNFAILIFVLWRFAYKPILKMLEERRLKIEQSLKDSEEATLKLEESNKEFKRIISEARVEASTIVFEAQERAEIKYQELITKAKVDIKKVIDKEKFGIAQEKAAIYEQLKTELSSLLVLSLEKFLGENIDEKKDSQAIARLVKELS